MAIQTTTAKVSSAALRVSAIIFFRFFPAHFPAITFALFAIYVPSFLASYYGKPVYEVVDDKIDVKVKETVVEPDTPLVNSNGRPVVSTPEIVSERVQIEERLTVAEKTPTPWRILLNGLPSPKLPAASALTFFVNLLLVILTVDALYRARLFYPADDLSFVRLGHVSPSEAKFLIREPDQAQMPITFEIRMKDANPPFDNPVWQPAATVKATSNESDYTATVMLSLRHSQQRKYEWRTSNNHTGEFITPPKPGVMPEYHDGKFTFLTTSCILPRFPYSPFDHPLAIPGLRHLANKLPELGAQFMLFLGDFIYVDVPQRFGKSVDEYRMQYRQVYASPDWAPVAQNLSWVHVLDDHELSNDWSSNTTGIYDAAINPWNTYQADVNPPKAIMAGTRSSRRREATWYEFTQGPASFFMLDTRSYRSRNEVPFKDEEKTMLGDEQLADFLAWLARPEPKGVKWKMVASSIPFTKNWPVNVRDTWGGFLVERRKVLEAMWDAGARGTSVIILSGDRHEFAATRFPPPLESRWPETAAAYEFSASPLNQFASPLPSYRQTDEEDVKMKYIPSGSSKFGSVTIENIAGESTLSYHLFIDGKERWSTLLTSPPPREGEGGLGAFWGKIRFT